MGLLFRRERLRQCDVGGGVEVPVVAAFARGQPGPLEPKDLPNLRPGRNLQTQRLAGDRLPVVSAAEDRRRQRHRHMRVEIASFAFELWMPRQANPQVQIAGLRAADSVLAFAGHPHARSVADARRNADVHRPRVTVVLDRQATHGAVVGVFESQLDLLLDVASGARCAAAAGAASAAAARRVSSEAAAEERVAEVGEGMLVAEHLAHLVFGHRAEAAALRSATEVHVPAGLIRIEPAALRPGLLVIPPYLAELVVLLALLRIAEHFVRSVNLL